MFILDTLGKIKNYLGKERAFSLAELLITLSIFAILIITTTSLLLLNLKVAARVKARTRVREETSYLLKNLKKDIRNAESIDINYSGSLITRVIPFSGGTLEERCWNWEGGSKTVRRFIDSGCSGSSDFVTPGDISIESLSFSQVRVGENSVILIRLEAWKEGMSGDEDDSCSDADKQCLLKEVVVSTRIFENE